MNLREHIKNLITKSEFNASFGNNKNFSDLISLLVHRRAAQHLRANPALIEKAKANLNNWLNKNSEIGAWLEWKEILETKSLEHIIEIIIADTDEGQRLRSSSPFAGFVTDQERKELIEICEKAKPF